MSSPHTTVSPLDLVKEILRSPKSSAKSANINIENERSCFNGATSNSNVLLASKLYGEKTKAHKSSTTKRNLEIRHKKSCEAKWVRLGKLSLSKFDRDEIDAGSKLNDQHIKSAQVMIKCQFSLEGLQ